MTVKRALVVLGVGAHPDDLDIGAGGAFAKWARNGARCYYLVCTDGSRGSMDPKIRGRTLISARKKEERAAARILGVKEVFFLKYKDTELEPSMALKRDIVRHIRKLKPDIVVTHDPTFVYSRRGFINHSDHRATGIATIDAVYPLAKNKFSFEGLERKGLKLHKVKELYLTNFENGNETVDISGVIDLKVKAVARHKSQFGGDAGFVRHIGSMLGKKKGLKYAESFVKLNLW